MIYDFATMPIEIYADLLEEQGLDVAELRAWVPSPDGSCSLFFHDAQDENEEDMGSTYYDEWGIDCSRAHKDWQGGLASAAVHLSGNGIRQERI